MVARPAHIHALLDELERLASTKKLNAKGPHLTQSPQLSLVGSTGGFTLSFFGDSRVGHAGDLQAAPSPVGLVGHGQAAHACTLTDGDCQSHVQIVQSRGQQG